MQAYYAIFGYFYRASATCCEAFTAGGGGFYGGDEVVGAGEGLGVAGEGVALAVDEAGHAVEHLERRF